MPKMDCTDNEVKDERTHASWIFFFRQLFVDSFVVTGFLTYGLYMGSITVMIPQIRREANSTDCLAVTTEMASWLSCLPGYSGILWGLLLPFVAHRFGRKLPLIIISINTLVSNIIFYCSTSVVELFICQVMTGMLEGSVNTITIMVVTEYTSPRYRGIFMTLKSASLYWGIWISNAIGTFFHWKNIGLLMLVLSIYNLAVIFCPESPFWLATRSRFAECSQHHRWLKGNTKESEEELEKIIASQKARRSIASKQRDIKVNVIVKFYRIVSSKNFYKPTVYAILGTALYHSCGKLAYSVYAIEIIKKITGNESTAYKGMFILDAVTIFGMYLGSFITKILKRRTQLLCFSSIGVGFLFILSIYLYMIKFNVILENNYISIFLLAGFSIFISCGPIIMTACCYGELTPLKYRSTYVCVLNLISSIATGSNLKSAPFIFSYFGSHGAFLFYAVSSTIFIYLLYKYLPETKDKTILEIEKLVAGDYTNTVSKSIDDESTSLK